MARDKDIKNSGRGGSPLLENVTAIVQSVVLTLDDVNLKKLHEGNPNYEELSLEHIGGITIRPVRDPVLRVNSGVIIQPLDRNNTDFPIVGETVDLVSNGGVVYYRRQSSTNINIGNASEDVDLLVYPIEQSQSSPSSQDYKENNQSGTPNPNTRDNQNRKSKFGTYFQYRKINQLKPYEGDKIIQSRFGQSIRFSGYNNANNVFSPTIILRNGQGQNNTKFNTIIEEDINVDGSTILIGSGEYKSNFSATTSIKPTKFLNYPNELKGNQLIFNSDRILISSRSGEMIFHSKGNYGFISDGKFSIDNGLGADLDFGGAVNITTTRTNSNILFNSGTGKLFLNTNTSGKSPNTAKPSEPLVRGNTLKEILETMITLINAQVFRTPSGPTAIGPENRTEFDALKKRLSEMLSTLNYTE
jgi:hypothetical protein